MALQFSVHGRRVRNIPEQSSMDLSGKCRVFSCNLIKKNMTMSLMSVWWRIHGNNLNN